LEGSNFVARWRGILKLLKACEIAGEGLNEVPLLERSKRRAVPDLERPAASGMWGDSAYPSAEALRSRSPGSTFRRRKLPSASLVA
jgi:hypothetical protein